MNAPNEVIGVIGLGYVGLPLAAAFAPHFRVIGYDASAARVDALNAGHDETGEVADGELIHPNLVYTANPEDLKEATFIIVAVPTPLTSSREPDLAYLESASEVAGRILKKGDMVVYESTVYPGVTEEDCLPILEKVSGMKLGEFDLGYSPERVNPGDKEHTVTTIVKVVSGHDEKACARAAGVYGSIVKAGVHCASTIKTAEAAKVIENVQRDLNISLMNELSKIFNRMHINTNEVLDAAATKWNFHRYNPGLVGGHCIGVDPYYLTHRAVKLGYNPEVILAGRRINDGMGEYVSDRTIRLMISAGVLPKGATVWVLGVTFKENVPDFRNTRAVDVIRHLETYGVKVKVWEPLVDAEEITKRFGYETLPYDQAENLDAVILINGHQAFRDISLVGLKEKMNTPVLFDVKDFFSREEAVNSGWFYESL